MLKEYWRLVSRFVMLTDLLLIAAAFLLAHILRNSSFFVHIFGQIGPFAKYQGMLFITLPISYFVFKYSGFYASQRTVSYLRLLWMVFRALFIVAICLAAFIFFLKAKFFSRSLYLFFLVIAFTLISLEKGAIRFAQQWVRKRGYNFRNCLLVGTQEKLKGFVERVAQHEEWGLKIIGLVPIDSEPSPSQYPVLGRWESLPAILRDRVVDEVIFAVPHQYLPELEKHIQECEEVGVTARVIADFISPALAKAKISDLDGLPSVTYSTTPQDAAFLSLKRGMDIGGSVLGLICLSPVFCIIAVAVKLSSPGPVFFKQKRMGKNGRLFTLYKFRSMYIDAEERKKELEVLNEMRGPVFKIEDDPRRTRVGKFLRRSSLDETPQFWNVLRGDMSLVGPRPPLPDEVKEYDVWQRRRLSMKPGLTCLWQIEGRNRIDFNEWMKLDLQYIDTWSLCLDIKLLWKTIPSLVSGKGAS